MYFPPNSDTWETKTPDEAGLNSNAIPELLDYLEAKNTKGFILLHNGKIVIESYFNGHDATSPWYWASAGKTLTATLTGIAEQEGFISIDEKISTYLGTGWTSLSSDKEILITPKHLLTMTSGLDDTLGDEVSPENLQYLSDAGTRWAYHNVYVKLQDVVANATAATWADYFYEKIRNPLGMNGMWVSLGDLSVYYSNTRSMARFGLMALNNGNWDGIQIINENYFEQSINTSQNINLSYGYLWWLNGKSSFHLPQSQWEFNGALIPNAPTDMYAAMGKNDQRIYIVPGKNIVIIRMGNAADGENFALSEFDTTLWDYLNVVINN
jgi:CubicO group peptidase (beta-lactamase class C family)